MYSFDSVKEAVIPILIRMAFCEAVGLEWTTCIVPEGQFDLQHNQYIL